VTAVQHHPGKCKEALAGTDSPVVLDLETTGLTRHDKIVSAGLLIDGMAHILFVRSIHASIKNIPLPTFYDALAPLQRPDLVVIAHNAIFDIGCLRREGIVVRGEVRDTMKLLKLLDQDRGRSARESETEDGQGGKEGAVLHTRRDLKAPEAASSTLNYALKDVVGQLLGIRMKEFPGPVELAPYDVHARYLASDLLGTWKLYEHLWPQLAESERTYYQTLVSPLIHLLTAMSDIGVQADPAFAWKEANRLDLLMQQLSADHEKQFGVALGMNYAEMVRWLHDQLKLPKFTKRHGAGQHRLALDSDTLKQLANYTEDQNARASLQMIQDYRQAASLLMRLKSLPPRVDGTTGRVHSKFDDTQASGRVSSTYPNLQQLAKVKEIGGERFLTRNFLRATPGYELAVFDIGQADIRALAHAVETFPTTADEHRRQLQVERRQRMPSWFDSYYFQLEQFCNPAFSGQHQERPFFNPATPPDLAKLFTDPKGDFYTLAAQDILGRPPVDKQERNRFKAVILSIVNGQGPPSLAKALDCSVDEAEGYLRDFDKAFPKVAAFKQLMHWQIAYTGRTHTFMGRPRTVTAHHWMVSEPRVELFVAYKGGEAYWLDVVPLEPARTDHLGAERLECKN